MPDLFDILRVALEVAGCVLAMGIGIQPCCCGGAACIFCTSGTVADELEVTIAGLANGTCSNCGDLNDTYILQSVGEVPAGCCWTYEFSETCGWDQIVACISHPIASDYFLEVSFGRVAGAAFVVTYLKNLGSDRPSCNWSALDVPVTAQVEDPCDDDSSTCTVTSL